MGLGYYSGYDAQTMGDAADRIEELEAALKRARRFIEEITIFTELKRRQPALGGRQELAAIDGVLGVARTEQERGK